MFIYTYRDMVLIIHGFPNDISALRFEWAWQNPHRSRRLQHLPRKKYKETKFDFNFRIMSEMLRTGPWSRLPLTIRWLKNQYTQFFPPDSLPPSHMNVCYGEVKCSKPKKKKKKTDGGGEESNELSSFPMCEVCDGPIDQSERVECLSDNCSMESHLKCLATNFLGVERDQLIPIEGNCPVCKTKMLWGEVIKQKRREKDSSDKVGVASGVTKRKQTQSS